MPLKSQIESLAAKFADEIFVALRTAYIHEIEGVDLRRPPRQQEAAGEKAVTKRRHGPRGPRGAEGESTIDRVAKLLEEHPAGLRAEHLRKAIGGSAGELRRHLRAGLETGAITKHGERRATVYRPGGHGAPLAEST